jgi:hypothetical protein
MRTSFTNKPIAMNHFNYKSIKHITLLVLSIISAVFVNAQTTGITVNNPAGTISSSTGKVCFSTDTLSTTGPVIANKISIGSTTFPSTLNIGSSNQFQVNSSGNLIKINGVSYTWPTSQGSSSTILVNDGTGTMTWGSLNSVNYWQQSGSDIAYPSGRIGIGTSTLRASLEVNGSIVVDGSNFIGTVDNIPLVFRVNNQPSATIDPVLNTTFLGYYAGNPSVTGGNNIAIGYSALGSIASGYGNIASGYGALTSNTSGSYNVSIGYNALRYNNTDGNVAIGYIALQANSTGRVNSAMGYGALSSVNNDYNTAMGAYAGNQTTSGAYNTALGGHALFSNIEGSNNTAIGYGADVGSENLTNATAIGYQAIVSTSNSVVLGGTGSYAVNVGIGTTSPAHALDVVGDIQVATGNLIIGSGANITAPSGSISFVNNNLSTTGALNAGNVTFNGTVTLPTDTIGDTNVHLMSIDKHGSLKPLTSGLLQQLVQPPIKLLGPCSGTTIPSKWQITTPTGPFGAVVYTIPCEFVGVGTQSPDAALSISNSMATNQFSVINPTSTNDVFAIDLNGNTNLSGTFSITNPNTSYNVFTIDNAGNTNISGLVTMNNGTYITGKVVIGNASIPPTSLNINTTTNYGLYVAGGILTENVKVALHTDLINWSDYVFASDYKLKSLNEVNEFIKKNKHLPEVPSSDDVHKDGIDMVQMDATLLKKIEELTLYLIQQQQQTTQQADEIKQLQTELAELKKKK